MVSTITGPEILVSATDAISAIEQTWTKLSPQEQNLCQGYLEKADYHMERTKHYFKLAKELTDGK